ncbi:hypothetical protein SDC9_201252 [bioreactor metagenome]|uniref:Uncharacterized protein n=1 Tax=bioreactor metagenome TaxID=1076179 RepID=A0A645IQE3_9ZZZZ
MKQRIKSRETRGNPGGIASRGDVAASYLDDSPAFSLKFLQRTHCLSACIEREKADFAEAIFKRRNMTWNQLIQSGRHELGCEKITGNMKVALPDIAKKKTILAFRFSGNKPMIGFRERGVFFILWFDRDFSVYDHG